MKRIALLCIAGCLIVVPAFAAQPRAPGHYVASHPAFTLAFFTKKHDITVFACFAKDGNHYDNLKPIHVQRDGSFSYNGVLTYTSGTKQGHMTLKGKFVSKDKATGTYTAPCAKSHKFTAKFTNQAG